VTTTAAQALAPPPPLLAGLDLLHQLPGRVRWRVRTHGVALDAQFISRCARSLPGVRQLQFNARTRSLLLHFDPQQTDPERLRASLLALQPEAAGAGAAPARPALAAGTHTAAAPEAHAVLASAALLLGSGLLPEGLRTPATLAVSLPLYREAWADLQAEGINSHVLEALAVGISTASADHLAANTTVFMLALGEYLEQSIARRSDDLLKELLRPDTGGLGRRRRRRAPTGV